MLNTQDLDVFNVSFNAQLHLQLDCLRSGLVPAWSKTSHGMTKPGILGQGGSTSNGQYNLAAGCDGIPLSINDQLEKRVTLAHISSWIQSLASFSNGEEMKPCSLSSYMSKKTNQATNNSNQSTACIMRSFFFAVNHSTLDDQILTQCQEPRYPFYLWSNADTPHNWGCLHCLHKMHMMHHL